MALIREEESIYYTNWEGKGLEKPSLPPDVRDWLQPVGLVTKEDYLVHPEVGKVCMGLGWDSRMDIDGSAALFDMELRCVDTVWWHKLETSCRSVRHSGDNRTGEGDGYDEVITVDISRIPLHVHHLLFTVSVYSLGMSFSQVRQAHVDMMHGKAKHRGHRLCSFSLTEMEGSAMLLGFMTRRGAYWNFRALGHPATGRTIQELIQNPANLDCMKDVLSFPPRLRRVSVQVLEGSGLMPQDEGTVGRKPSSDPFFVMKFKRKRVTSHVHQETLEPKWNEPPFDLGMLSEAETKALKIYLYDYDADGSHDSMGGLWIPGSALYNCQIGMTSFWFDVGPMNKKAPRDSKMYGRILLSITVQDS